jgi:hypothetical protein
MSGFSTPDRDTETVGMAAVRTKSHSECKAECPRRVESNPSRPPAQVSSVRFYPLGSVTRNGGQLLANQPRGRIVPRPAIAEPRRGLAAVRGLVCLLASGSATGGAENQVHFVGGDAPLEKPAPVGVYRIGQQSLGGL